MTMTQIIDGVEVELTPEEEAAVWAERAVDMLESCIQAIIEQTDAMLDRDYTWGDVGTRLDDLSLIRTCRQTESNVRAQLGEEPWNINVDASGDPASVTFTGSIADTILTVGTLTEARTGVAGRIGIGTQISGAGVAAGTRIVGRVTGIGEAGDYLVAPSQTVGSVTMTAAGWFKDIFAVGDGVAKVFRKADGSYYGFNSGNQIGLRDACDDKEQAIFVKASDFYDDVTAANTGTDQEKVAALTLVLANINTAANWPNTTL